MTANIKEMGLSYTKKYIGYTTLSVVDWTKFFPIINVQAEQSLINIATNYWCASVSYNSTKNDFIFDVRIDGIKMGYIITHRTGYKSVVKYLCSYDKNDIRRYTWISVLKQYNYAKICKDTQDVLINLLVGKK